MRGSGTINVTIHTIHNPGGFDQDRSCCDGTLKVCRGAPTCDTVLAACVTDAPIDRETCFDSPMTPKFKSKQYENQNNVLLPEGENVNNTNPMSIKFVQWKVSSLKTTRCTYMRKEHAK